MKALVGSLLLCAVAPLAACDTQTCTLAGCGAALDVRITVDDGGVLPDASYEIVLELDGMPYVTACGRPEPGMLICEAVEGPEGFVVGAGPSTDGTAIVLSVSFDADERDGPQSVRVTVVAGDAPLVDTTAAPTYEASFPNGEDCEPRCLTTDPIVATFARP